ncbi:hypothetical protein [Haloferax larsenii]|uniref:Uncharacterized protein n=1 Tax=Haloferax larsenii TaxID=302484 RepID=A0A1H7Q2A6_HALLR|nr:hypothetical protein [Haloferax larsenii]SEL41966.1 hypothetical protein SAMN04488691_104277 [Haloferax larsenii]
MPRFTQRIADGWEHALDITPLTLIPILFACLEIDKIQSVLAHDGVYFGVQFGFPHAVGTVWSFVSAPTSGLTVRFGIVDGMSPTILLLVAATVVVKSALTAGYFGSVASYLERGSYDFFAHVRAYFVPFLLLGVLPFLVLLPLAAGVGFHSGGFGGGIAVLFVASMVVFLGVSYLFYATPYLLVLRELGLVAALQESYSLAVRGGSYVSYFLGYVAFTACVSLVASAMVVNIPVVGLLVGIVGGSLLGLALNIATMRFVADIDPESPTLVEWEPSDGDDSSHPA